MCVVENDNVVPTDFRKATCFLNYRGDVVDAIEERIKSGMPFGPTALREPVWPLWANYNSESDTTRVGCSYMAPPATEVLGNRK